MTVPILPNSLHNGTLTIESVALSCHSLENGQRLFSADGIEKAMGYDGPSENWLFEFMSHLNRLMPIDPDLLEALSVAILFQYRPNSGAVAVKQGVRPNVFLDACVAIIKAKNEGFLFVSELKFAKAAEIIVKNVHPSQVETLIDFASGLELFKSNHKELLCRFMKNRWEMNCFIWIMTFPDSFFETIFKFKKWEWTDLNHNTAEVADFLSDIIFSRIEDPLLDVLDASKPRMKYRKKNNPQTYLENAQLGAHLQSIVTLIKISEREINLFTLLLNNAFPKIRNFKKMSLASEKAKSLSQFDQQLLKTVLNRKP